MEFHELANQAAELHRKEQYKFPGPHYLCTTYWPFLRCYRGKDLPVYEPKLIGSLL